jgi:hypothetical protein
VIQIVKGKKHMLPKISQSLFMTAVVGIATIGSPLSTEAGNLPGRAGKSDYPTSEPNCWQPNGATVTNGCTSPKYLWFPLVSVNAGGVWPTVTAQGANNNNNVLCAASGYHGDGTFMMFSGWINLPQFGPAREINLYTGVPSGGVGVVDCLVYPGGKIHTLRW